LLAGNNTYLAGNFTIRGLPDIEQTLFDMHLSRFSTNRHDIETLVPQLGNSPTLKLPTLIDHMGDLTYQGALRGHYYDFVANGLLHTQLGTVTTDINLTIRNGITYSGQLLTTAFDLGSLLQQTQLGSSGFDITIEGTGFALQDINSVVTGRVDYLEYRDYRSRNINLGGTFADMRFAGDIAVNDPNLQLHFDGDVNLNPRFPEHTFTATVDYANLYPIHLYQKSPITVENASIVSNFKGSTINDIQGDIAIHDVRFRTHAERYVVDSLTLSANGNQAYRTLAIKS